VLNPLANCDGGPGPCGGGGVGGSRGFAWSRGKFPHFTEPVASYGGLRYWDVDSTVTVGGGGPLGETISGPLSEDWVDLLYGLRSPLPRGDKWTLVRRGRLAPFGPGRC